MHHEVVVADAGPLIALARIGRLELLPALFTRVRIAVAVREEVAGADVVGRAGAREVATADWLVAEVADPAVVRAFQTMLDRGEAESLAVALAHPGALLLIDERRGRQVATSAGLRVIGTLAVLLQAKRHGHLEQLAPEIAALRTAGVFIAESLVRDALEIAGEAR